MDIRGKGEQMGKDILAYLRKELEYKPFLRAYGIEVVRIVENNFEVEVLDILEKHKGNAEAAKDDIKGVGNKISLFCAAFV